MEDAQARSESDFGISCDHGTKVLDHPCLQEKGEECQVPFHHQKRGREHSARNGYKTLLDKGPMGLGPVEITVTSVGFSPHPERREVAYLPSEKQLWMLQRGRVT